MDAPGREVSATSSKADEVLAQIVRHVELLSLNGHTEVRMQLEPQSLGRLSLLMTSDRDTVSVQLRAETPEVRDLVQANLGQLQAALNEHGVKVDRLAVLVGSALWSFDGQGRGQRPTTDDSVRRSPAIGEDETEVSQMEGLVRLHGDRGQHLVDCLV